MVNHPIINRIKEVIYTKDPEAEAYLFGSRARGDAKPTSDWDILILVNESKVTNLIEDKFRDGFYDIELDTGQIISTFIYPKEFWNKKLLWSPLYKNVQKEGLPL